MHIYDLWGDKGCLFCVKHTHGSQGEEGSPRISLAAASGVSLELLNTRTEGLRIHVQKGCALIPEGKKVPWAALAGLNRVTSTEELPPLPPQPASPG